MIALQIAVVVVLTLLNGFFVLAEMAVVSARRGRLQQMAEEGSKGAAVALALSDDPSRFLSAIQTGITLIGVLTGAYGGSTLSGPFGEWLNEFAWMEGHGEGVAFGLVIVAITLLTLIFGELVPKRVALNHSERLAAATAPALAGLARVAAPVVWALGWLTEAVLRLLRVHERSDNAVTEEEVKSLIAEGTATGVFEPAERSMIEGVMRLTDRTVRSIMTPRIDMVWLDPDDDADEARRTIADSGHSRFPVGRQDPDEVLGILHVKDLVDTAFRGAPFSVKGLVRDALVVHDLTPVLRLMELFKEEHQQMAVVVDEYGSVEGIVTVTDVLVAIAGELPDEGDAPGNELVRRADGSYLIDGMMAIEDAEAALGLKNLKDEGDFHTLAGFVLHGLGHLPTVGERFAHDGHFFEVIDMDGRRIDKVLVTPQPRDES
jgi:putative hemolysin